MYLMLVPIMFNSKSLQPLKILSIFKPYFNLLLKQMSLILLLHFITILTFDS